MYVYVLFRLSRAQIHESRIFGDEFYLLEQKKFLLFTQQTASSDEITDEKWVRCRFTSMWAMSSWIFGITPRLALLHPGGLPEALNLG